MREAEPVQLIDDEQAKDDNGGRIVPKFLAQKPDDQP
jgi:hypothetical protein